MVIAVVAALYMIFATAIYLTVPCKAKKSTGCEDQNEVL